MPRQERRQTSQVHPAAGWLLLLLLLTCQLLAPAVPAAAPAASAEKEITSSRIKIHRLQQGISRQEEQMAESVMEERDILEELEKIDKTLARQQEKLRDLEGRMQKQQLLIDKEEEALTTNRDKKAAVEEHLKKRMTAYYTMGDIGLLNVTFSTRTLPELLTFHDAFDTLIKYDQDLIERYRGAIQEIERTRTALDLEKGVLQEFIRQLVAENDILEQAKSDKQLLLTQIQTKARLHKQVIKEMQRASEQLSKAIVSLESRQQVPDQQFFASKGSLPPPVNGTLISRFGQEKVNTLGIARNLQGIELQASDGSQVVAVADGEVMYSGYLRGYGNTVIIHHGLQYYTVTSRIEELLVDQGRQIKANEPIGVMGDTAMLFDEGLYFEIRQGSQSLDPLAWLNPKRIAARQEPSADPAGTGSVQ